MSETNGNSWAGLMRSYGVSDATADRLDAVLCLMQAGWAAARPNHGLPTDADKLEGWIVTAPFASQP